VSSNNDNHLSQREAQDRIWDLAESIRICMFVTWDGERQRARPLAAMPAKDEQAVYFLTDVNGLKDDQIERFPIVTLAFADTGGNKYVSITGHATVSNDRAKIKELWSAPNKAWWDSPEDPTIRLITVRPDDAELWDSPGTVVSTVKMLAAAVTGAKPDMGVNEKVRL
jgi:general stress protein 26